MAKKRAFVLLTIRNCFKGPLLAGSGHSPAFQFLRISVPHPPPRNLNLDDRYWFGVRSKKSLEDLSLTRLGRPSDPRQVRKRFGFSQARRFGHKETLRILQVTESDRPQLHCLIIRLSGVRVPVGRHFPSFSTT